MLAALVIAAALDGSPDRSPGVALAAQACLASGGRAATLAEIAAAQGWRRLEVSHAEALRDGTVVPASEAAYAAPGGLVHIEDYRVTVLCSVHFRGDLQTTQAEIESWVIGDRSLGQPTMVQPRVTNVLVTDWRNQFWAVTRAGVDAVNFSNDPEGSQSIIELSFPKAR
ncbi:MAG: hypothetical protein ACK51B_01295 [bacterium]|jgi:hypothetical protein